MIFKPTVDQGFYFMKTLDLNFWGIFIKIIKKKKREEGGVKESEKERWILKYLNNCENLMSDSLKKRLVCHRPMHISARKS